MADGRAGSAAIVRNTVGPAEKTYVLTFQAKQPQSGPDGLNIGPSFLIGDTAGTLWLFDIPLAPGKATERL